jgi:glutathione S-transferase
VPVRIAELDRLGDRLGVPDQEHLHGASVLRCAAMKLFGTTTSPFVRRVRIVAAEVGEPIDRIDTATDAGQAQLRELSPIWKVPAAVIDGRTIYDSRAIIDWLVTTRGWGGLQPPRDRWRELNLINAIDGALEGIIQLFYLRRDGVAIDGTVYAKHNLDRADAIFAWLGKELRADGFGLPEIAAICALDWMDFRKTYPTERAAALHAVRSAWAERPSVASTRPHS